MLANLSSKISGKPYKLFLVTAILLFAYSFIDSEKSFDFHLYDTYYIISNSLFIQAIGTALLLLWTAYELLGNTLWKRSLAWFHILVTLFILIIFLQSNLWGHKLTPSIEEDFSYEDFQAVKARESKIMLSLVVLFLAGQLAFILNIFVGVARKLLENR
ncbi:hypothetical protein [Flavihumibacter solisilvae]|uniref:Uncharacterized protein n=1 Tax=Flavihumibacter solisilvae TaxID=1349421 RepID=A0A0C1LFH6_9BACT|nr:hypothetical protein [Flavihumibacter solisilvae]KIC94088.1 hypothetical protein OI18_13885 [Flavihumibacter solisilvae]